jgi:hypothetical protein
MYAHSLKLNDVSEPLNGSVGAGEGRGAATEPKIRARHRHISLKAPKDRQNEGFVIGGWQFRWSNEVMGKNA